jgi:hypothetical protein
MISSNSGGTIAFKCTQAQAAFNTLQNAVNTAIALENAAQAQAGKGTQEAQDAAQNAYNQAKQVVDQASSLFDDAIAQLNKIDITKELDSFRIDLQSNLPSLEFESKIEVNSEIFLYFFNLNFKFQKDNEEEDIDIIDRSLNNFDDKNIY